MRNADLIRIASQWERNAATYDKRNAGINRSPCHEGKRQLLVGMAEQSRSCAQQLRKMAEKDEAAIAPPSAPVVNQDNASE